MNHDLIVRNETNTNSLGGTELLQNRLYDGSVPRALLEQFQIIFSRVRDLDESKFRIYYAHDLAGDPEADAALLNDGWKRFHMLVFVSNWQMQTYIGRYQVPWSMCVVIPNSINPIAIKSRPAEGADSNKLRLIYTSTPHRGLNILYAVFEALFTKYSGSLELDVYSSFKLYGWEQRDTEFQDLFNKLEAHPGINYHGTASNDEVRAALSNAQIFAYPSTWTETSCLCLIEAMSAGLLCAHPNLGALYETSAGHTFMYQWDENLNRHANVFYAVLDAAIQQYHEESVQSSLRIQESLTDRYHSWERRADDWTALLTMITNTAPDRALPKPCFIYNS